MKKYMALLIITTLLIAAAFSIPYISELAARDTDTAYVFCDDYTDGVVCSGKITNSENITVESPCSFIVKKVCILKGNKVKEGDTLITVDKTATAKLLSTYSGNASSVISQIPDEIKAEQDGVVSSLNTTDGSAVTAGQELMKISGESNLRVKININENVISNVKIGQSVKITGNAFGDYVYTGVLSELADEAKTITSVTGTSTETIVEGYVDITNPDAKLKPGYTVKADIITNTVKDAIIVPYDAVVQDNNNNKYVYKIVDGWAVKQFFNEAFETGEGVAVSSGINLNDMVAVNVENTNSNIKYFRVKTGNEK